MAKIKQRRSGGEAGMDLTPMIDVVFQLIIFFVVTVNLDRQSVLEKIELPDAAHSREEKRKDPRQITIQVDKNGRYYIGSMPYKLRDLRNVLKNTVRTSGTANIPIVIRGDMNAMHRNVRRVMDVCAATGLYKIKFAGLKQGAAKQPRAP